MNQEKPLYHTADGKPVYKGNDVYSISRLCDDTDVHSNEIDFEKFDGCFYNESGEFPPRTDLTLFLSKEDAYIWWLKNRPSISYQQIADYFLFNHFNAIDTNNLLAHIWSKVILFD